MRAQNSGVESRGLDSESVQPVRSESLLGEGSRERFLRHRKTLEVPHTGHVTLGWQRSSRRLLATGWSYTTTTVHNITNRSIHD